MLKIKLKNQEGFVLLFAVVLASILLSITLGISNIALKELKFSTSARETNDAFFAADSGIECALMSDKIPAPNRFNSPPPHASTTISCNGNGTIPASYTGSATTGTYTFILTGLGSNNSSCARVTIDKDDNAVFPQFQRDRPRPPFL